MGRRKESWREEGRAVGREAREGKVGRMERRREMQRRKTVKGRKGRRISGEMIKGGGGEGRTGKEEREEGKEDWNDRCSSSGCRSPGSSCPPGLQLVSLGDP